MKKKIWLILINLTILICLIWACISISNSRYQSHEDEFYNDMGAYPSARLPLIKPYELYSKEGEPWSLNLFTGLWSPPPDDTFLYSSVRDVRKISVENGLIMVYSPHVNEQVEQSTRKYFFHWFVVIPDKGIEIGFNNEDEFLKYIQQSGIQEPDWREPNDIYDEYVETECLDWIPDCK